MIGILTVEQKLQHTYQNDIYKNLRKSIRPKEKKEMKRF
jgi:hypothetical protein